MKRWLLSAALFVLTATAAQAHFIWIVPDAGSADSAKVVFSDALEPDENVSIDKIAAVKLNVRDAAGKTLPIELKKDKHAFLLKTPAPGAATIAGACEYGVLQKGTAKPFLLVYHPKWVRGNVHAAVAVDRATFEIVGKGEGKFIVLFEGKPLASAEVNVMAPDQKETLTTSDKGEFSIKSTAPGLYGLRAKHVLAKAGELQGKKYDEARHYATLVFEQPKGAAKPQAKVVFPALPEAFSSFGAAVADGYVYVYGGHVGKTHTYSTEAVTKKFRRLNLAQPAKGWEELPTGPHAQGLALVAHGGKLYRIGGMQPRNKPGDPADNHSLAECAVYDPEVGQWAPMPALPAGRSSHDAVVVGDTIVVAGGWQLNGAGGKSVWHTTTLTLDLSKTGAKWESIPQPFERRALNLGALDGKVFVVCGMNSENENEKTVDILDLAARKWSKGPTLPGGVRNGFTPAVCSLAGKIYASPSDGKVYRLTEKRDAWEEIATLEKQRVVHRIVPVGDDTLLVLGGAGKGGNVAQSETIEVSCCSAVPVKAATLDPTKQNFCPIMTSVPLDAEARDVDYNGVKIKVCCFTCVKKWNADPAAYLNVALLPQLKGVVIPARAVAQVYCPVYKDRVVSAKGPSTEYQGQTIYFFNETAKRNFLADPMRYADAKLLPQLRGGQ